MKATTRCSDGCVRETDEPPAERAPAQRRTRFHVGQVVVIHATLTSSKVELYEIVKLDVDGVCATLRPLGTYAINGNSTSLQDVDVMCLRPWTKPTTTRKRCKYCHATQPLENFRHHSRKCRRCEADEQRSRDRGGYVTLKERMREKESHLLPADEEAV